MQRCVWWAAAAGLAWASLGASAYGSEDEYYDRSAVRSSIPIQYYSCMQCMMHRSSAPAFAACPAAPYLPQPWPPAPVPVAMPMAPPDDPPPPYHTV
ncbi:Protein of unknown function, partial [Gryllus bimaculatus]